MPYWAPAKCGDWISWSLNPVIPGDYINKQCNKGVFMFMFLPLFLPCTERGNGAINRKDKVSYILWAVFYSSSLFYHSFIIWPIRWLCHFLRVLMKTHHHPTTFVNLINQVGLLGDMRYSGCSFIINSSGMSCLVNCPIQRAGLIIAGLAFYLTSALVYGYTLHGMVIIGGIWPSYGIPANMFAYHAWHRIWFCIFGLHFYTDSDYVNSDYYCCCGNSDEISSMNVAFRSLNINRTCSVLSVGYFCYWLLPTLFQLYWNVAEYCC